MKQEHIISAALAFTCTMVASTTSAQNHPAFDGRLTLAPADATSSSAGGAGDDDKE